MAQFVLVIPDAQLDRVVKAMCDGQMIDALTPAVPTPALAKQMLITMIKERVRNYETLQAQKAININNLDTLIT